MALFIVSWSKIVILFFALEASLLIEVSAKIRVETGHFFRPILNRTEDAIVLQNNKVLVQFKCLAKYPTEWIFNDDNLSRNAQQRLRIEWTDRKFRKSIDEDVYDYIAWIHLNYGQVLETDEMLCRSIGNHNDYVKVRLQPNNNGEVQVTFEEAPSESEVKDFSVPAVALLRNEPKGSATPSRQIQFRFLEMPKGYYYGLCETTDGRVVNNTGKLIFHECRYSAAQCANSFRAIKQLNKRIELNAHLGTEFVEPGENWSFMNIDKLEIPGVAVCSIVNENGETERRAVEYFFSSRINSNSNDSSRTIQKEIHFSWNEINPVDLIQLDLNRNVYNTDEILSASCRVPKYGFSFDPVVIFATANGTTLVLERDYVEDHETESWFKKITINLGKHGPGHYEVQCVAPIWNTTEWVYKSKAIQVIETQSSSSNESASKVPSSFSDTNIVLRLDRINNNIQQLERTENVHFLKVETLLEKLVSIQQKQLKIQDELLSLKKGVQVQSVQ